MGETEVTFGTGLHGIVDGAGGERGAVIITHGAGQGMDSPLLMKTAKRLAEIGFVVLRFNFAYMGNKPAPSAGGKNEKPQVVEAIEFMKDRGDPILIGKSFGARVASYVAAERKDIRALAFYGMPLQGISRTSKPRDWSHLGRIAAPMLFVTGNKDKLCPLEELDEVLRQIKSPLTSQIVAGDHSFKPKSEDAAIEFCMQWIESITNHKFEPGSEPAHRF